MFLSFILTFCFYLYAYFRLPLICNVYPFEAFFSAAGLRYCILHADIPLVYLVMVISFSTPAGNLINPTRGGCFPKQAKLIQFSH